MHPDERRVGVGLVRRLLEAQFPAWARRPLEPVASTGTDNALFRLGDDLVVRLPRIGWAVDGTRREQDWLPRLAPRLPVEVPAVVGRGRPGAGYPWPWSVCRWIEGENPDPDRLGPPVALARALGRFVAALGAVEPEGGPPGRRGEPLAERHRATVDALAGCTDDEVDRPAVAAAWTRALEAGRWTAPGRWTHGDLAPGNLLVRHGRLAAVIDFGLAGLGDPACDLAVAWNLLPARSRPAFRAAAGCDADAWARGRGWALSVSLVQLPYYRQRNPALAASARRTVAAVLGDPGTDDRPGAGGEEVAALLEAAAGWARSHPDVRAVALVGSYARGRPAPGSDVDLVVLVDDPARFAPGAAWVPEALGRPARPVRTARWGPVLERRVVLESGLEVEFGFAPVSWAAVDPVDPGTAAVVAGGLRPVHDPDGHLARLLAAAG